MEDWEDVPRMRTFEPSVIDRAREGNNSGKCLETTTAPNTLREDFNVF